MNVIPGVNIPNVVAAPPDIRAGQALKRLRLVEANHINGLATEAHLGQYLGSLAQTVLPLLPPPAAVVAGGAPAWGVVLMNQVAGLANQVTADIGELVSSQCRHNKFIIICFYMKYLIREL